MFNSTVENLRKFGHQGQAFFNSLEQDLNSYLQSSDVKKLLQNIQKLEQQCSNDVLKTKIKALRVSAVKKVHTKQEIQAFNAQHNALESEIISNNQSPPLWHFCIQCIGVVICVVVVWYLINSDIIFNDISESK